MRENKKKGPQAKGEDEVEEEEEEEEEDNVDDDDDAEPSSTQLARRVSCIMPSCNAYLIQGQLYYSPLCIPYILQRKINGCATAPWPRQAIEREGAATRARWHKIIASFIPGNDLIAGYG